MGIVACNKFFVRSFVRNDCICVFCVRAVTSQMFGFHT